MSGYAANVKKVKGKAHGMGLDKLALSMALPHENPPVRFPAVPATMTGLLDVMSDGTVLVGDGTARRAFLCRDPAYPLWMERSCAQIGAALTCQGSATTWSLPAQTNADLVIPPWSTIYSYNGAGNMGTIDGVHINSEDVLEYTVLGNAPGTFAIYIPPGSTFDIVITTGAAGGATDSAIEFELGYQVGGETYTVCCNALTMGTGFEYRGIAGGNTSIFGTCSGTVPFGFVWVMAMRTTAVAPTAKSTPLVQLGWVTKDTFTSPGAAEVILMLPYSAPPEFNNSVLPYSRTRLNASAALFTNVTAVMSKEGTVLAARLKPAVADPWSFTSNNINSVHPSIRYFGPLEKGLYTFTSPTGTGPDFHDCWISMITGSVFNGTHRPLFHYQDIGVYNAMIFTDLGSSGTGNLGTQLAVSSYGHLEFEVTSSLFALGVSTAPLEVLHAAEVALLKFGHFHENPIHWAALAAAARTALQWVAPMVAPYAKAAFTKVIDSGVSYLKGKQAGDRSMPQAGLATPARRVKAKPKKKVKVTRRK